MKVGVITFPGSNCDRDLLTAWQVFNGVEVVSLWHKDRDLRGCDLICLPGGFSYGDYLRSGAIARFSPIMQEVIPFAERGGWVWGICNGFQILTECGLLPGALRRNLGMLFQHRNVYISASGWMQSATASSHRPALRLPIAHAEGNYYCTDEQLKALTDQDQIIFRYSGSAGELDAAYNPNGSLAHIAGICSPNGRVFALMPHPERAVDPLCGNTDGRNVFEAILTKFH